MKASATVENFTPQLLEDYVSLCGWALAKSHAKAGRSPEITGYIGKSVIFSKAVSEFALRYADQTEADFALFKNAEKNGRINVAYEKVDH